ncbi:1-deoxy-D-xylulose-5-phosphate reductoisomerase [bacterium]|nr:1-deoxy-D-xylulose-5-phosphate reductoisomerase [bacterium]MCI0603835.1 1-deoxy-D-xylulose-5-phosphate reductoisomerase [bacterium]
MKRISILGSTGSIGVNALDVVRRLQDRFQIIGLAAGKNVELLRQQALEFRPKIVSVADSRGAIDLRSELESRGIRVVCGEEGSVEVATHPDTGIVLSAMVGAKGFLPTLKAISSGKDVALANKETLVVAGPIISREVARKNTRLLPVDSEHSAIWQCLNGAKKDTVRKLILTASGGPFLERDLSSFHTITVNQALAHPNWRMGRKITIDSATLMNKGLEMIEAHYLFDEPPEKLDVIIHPQSVVHSMVEFIDGSVIAQLGISDMRMPIQFALSYPERWENDLPSIKLTEIRKLEFFEPDLQKFPCLKLAQQALNTGGTMTAVLNAANEVAVESFLAERIPFSGICHIVESTMEKHNPVADPSLEDVLQSDLWARTRARESVVHMQT